jgi:hypothetical protein
MRPPLPGKIAVQTSIAPVLSNDAFLCAFYVSAVRSYETILPCELCASLENRNPQLVEARPNEFGTPVFIEFRNFGAFVIPRFGGFVPSWLRG